MNKHFPIGDIHPIKYFYLVASVTGILFALISSTDNTSFLLHLIIWQLQAFIPITLLIIAHISCLKFNLFNSLKPWQQLLISGIVGSLLFAPFALLIDIYIVGESIPDNLIYEFADEASAVIPPVTIFWLLINLPWLNGLEYLKREEVTEKENNKVQNNLEQPLPEFLSMTPIKDINDIVYLSAQLHYLEVSTTNDKYLILYSLAKAIDEIPCHLGIQTHRSHWAATRYIKSINKIGRQGELLMKSGVKIPISRANLGKVTAFVETTAD